MFTVCPKCALTLVVTAADLRVAQGYVRCGRCSSVFNALARLTDDRQGSAAGTEAEAPSPAVESPEPGADPAAGAPPQQATLPAEVAPAADEEAIPDDALEFNPATTDVGSVFVEPPPDPQWTAETGSFRAMIAASEAEPQESPQPEVDVEIDAAFLASMLRAEDPRGPEAGRPPAPPTAAPPERAPAASGESRPREPPQREPPQRRPLQRQPPREPPQQRGADPATSAAGAPAAGGGPAMRHVARHTRPNRVAVSRPAPAALRTRTPPPPPPPGRAGSTARAEAPAPVPAAAAPEEGSPLAQFDAAYAPAGAAGATSALRHLWRAGTAVAVVLLAAQIVNHYRDELATSARFNRPLTALYAALGVRLVPHWDLHAYDVRQLGASVDQAGAGLITVRASIKNAAQQAQPLPLLRVTLQDRFGTPLASSDVAPRSYLPRAVPASSFLAGGQRIDAEMGFVDPGANAVGFEIDACLPTSRGGVACANDAAPR
jgi:predicted Zn finger-like uncharacterized protein